MQEIKETQVWSLGREDPLEEAMATHSSILAWRIPWTEELGGLQSIGSQRVRHDWSNLEQQSTMGEVEYISLLALITNTVVNSLNIYLSYQILRYSVASSASYLFFHSLHGVAKSRIRLSDFPFTFHFHASEKEMATHSRILAWRIPGTGEPGGLTSMGWHRIGHDWSHLAAVAVAASSSTTIEVLIFP